MRPNRVRSNGRRAEGGSEPLLRRASNVAWALLRRHHERRPRPPIKPRWSAEPLQRAANRSRPELGWPRTTDSLCPECVKEVRRAILSGEKDLSELVEARPGEIRAQILERDGRVVMEKHCPRHGAFDDVISIDVAFLARIEGLFFGRDFRSPKTPWRNHGSSSVQYGRGSVLTVDLTNRCNMMCDPCFMDANQVGYVHEPSWEDLRAILDRSLTILPRRQMSVQFSGGEPTLSPLFLRSVEYARQIGYFSVQCASNGIRFAEDLEFCHTAKRAGLRLCYLQFDGVSNEAHLHRRVGNLFDVKAQAIDNLYRAGIDVVLVVTVVNGVNSDQVGKVVQFGIDNADKVTVISFQPVSFTGRDEDITLERRRRERYTLSHLAHDLRAQLGVTEPERDWFPLSAMGPFSDVVDLLLGENAEFGAMKCGCHPNCGIGTVLLVHKHTKQMVPVLDFLNLEALLQDLQQIADAGQGRTLTLFSMAVALARNFDPRRAPPGFDLRTLVRQLLSQIGARGSSVGATEGDAGSFEWRFLFVAGMWFQDLFNYDFRRTEMCIIPYGTELGEISFCAYNTGVGWRQIIENLHKTASVAEWFREHGRHAVYAKGQRLALPPTEVDVIVRDAGGRPRRHLPLVS